MPDFTHLHVHTEYSLLDGACRIGQLADAARAMGQTALAITDHGNMFGVIDFYRACKKAGIKPIIGCEAYVAPRGRADRVHAIDYENRHLILLCKNNAGYKNLIAMVSEAWVNGFYNKPRIDRELLEKHHEGLIALSACLAGEVARSLAANDYEGAKKTALYYNDLFGEGNYYLELQDHGLADQKRVNDGLIRLSRETGIPMVATNDVHYLTQEDSRVQEVLICIQTNHTVGEDTGLDFGTSEFFLKSGDEMQSLFPEIPEAIANTRRIADMCEVEFEFGNTKLPRFKAPGGLSNDEYFLKLCYDGLRSRYGENPPKEHEDRLKYEIDTISHMGYTDYFLIVFDFIHHAKSQGIPVGPGRGSGAGSIAAYCMGITGIDPMKYNLLFERFLNPERVSMPDFDIDFCYERRQEVIDYVVRKYGADHVAQIITFGTMAARGSIRDVGRALGVPYATVDSIAKLVPFELKQTIANALKQSKELRTLYEDNEQVEDLLNMAQKVEGMPRNASTHAAGVVITADPVSSYVPLAVNGEAVVTQFTMTTLEELGLLKMDFLGLRTLTVIADSERMIRAREPDFSMDNISLEDKAVYDMLSAGLTDGVFQFESAGMRSVLMGLKPESLNDMMSVTALYRPGPMESIPKFIRNRHDPGLITYSTPLLKPILDVTYGCLLYQEQVMETVRSLAGYSLGRADIVRRAMSKKKHDVMERERQNFIHGLKNPDGTLECEGAVKRGVPEAVANDIFNEMTAFASYAFPKAHAAAYAFVAYQTAWLKCHYPCEFMAALLTSVLDSSTKVSDYIAECGRIGIAVLPPGVNGSGEGFVASGGKIRFGLLAVKNLGRGFIREIIAQRKAGGEYTSLYQFCKRLHGREFNRRAVESLIKCGALDGTGANRRQMLKMLEDVIDAIEHDKRRNLDGQIGLFDIAGGMDDSGPPLPGEPEFSVRELLFMEKEVTGLYLSGHPMAEYAECAARVGAARTIDLIESAQDAASPYRDGDAIELLGILTAVKQKVTRGNSTMAFAQLEDMHGGIEVIIFPKTLTENAAHIREGSVVHIKGRLSVREDEEPKAVCDSVFPVESPDYVPNPATARSRTYSANGGNRGESADAVRKDGLFLRIPSKDCEEFVKAKDLLKTGGQTPLHFYFEDTKKYDHRPPGEYIDVTDGLIMELNEILGGRNVVCRAKNQ